MTERTKEFSEFEITDCAVKMADATSTNYEALGAVGSCEENLDALTVTKKYEGVVAKSRTKGTGTGTLSLSLHMNYNIFTKVYGMEFSDVYKDGVYAYGKDSRHKEFSLVCNTINEDGEEKLKAYPRCVIQTGIARKTENGAEEVAEVELEIALMPDDDKKCMYEQIVPEGEAGTTLKNSWLTQFSTTLIKKGA